MITCLRCKLVHEDDYRACPAVKAIELEATTGYVTRVEYLTPLDYPQVTKTEEPEQDYPRLPSSN